MKCVNEDLLPIVMKLSVDPPCIVTLLAEPTSILELAPSNSKLPSPKLMDAFVELISMLVASNSNVPVLISKSVPVNLK